MEPPRTTPASIKQGDAGLAVWCLQRSLNSLSLFSAHPLVEDSSFGPITAAAVRTFQELKILTADAKAGPATQNILCQSLVKPTEQGLPQGLLLSIVDGESGRYIAAVNWSVPGGVDCGLTQRRVYSTTAARTGATGPKRPLAILPVEERHARLQAAGHSKAATESFDEGALLRAFDSLYQLKLLRSTLKERHDTFMTRAAVTSHELAYRLATLWHNYQTLSDRISRVGTKGLSSYYTSPQAWVESIGAKFPDGAKVSTPLEWGMKYSLGSAAHNEPGVMTRFVKDWSA